MPSSASTALDLLYKLLPFLIPVIILQLVLFFVSMIDLIRREKTRGPKWMWALIILFGELLGPILYLLVGRLE